MKHIIIAAVVAIFATFAQAQDTPKKLCKKKQHEPENIVLNSQGAGNNFIFTFTPGKYHNYPTLAIWIEDTEGNYIQDLFVTQSFAKGIFRYGAQQNGKWTEGPRRYQATLPYYLHKRATALHLTDIVPDSKQPVPDAYTGATPGADFSLKVNSNEIMKEKYRILIEINQAWDVNEYWYNNRFENDNDYKASCQPSLVYAVTIDPSDLMDEYVFNPIGHGHYSGKDGRLYTDLSTLTTALKIFTKISVVVAP